MDYVEENSPQQVLDLIHSITAFCRSEFPQEARRQSESKTPSYRNRFNEREKGIEGRIINATLRNLSTKLARIQDQLTEPENMSLLGDVRMLVNFIQEQHGNPFRRVGLSALLDAIDKSPKSESSEVPRRDESGKNSPSGLVPPIRGDQASLRRGLFRKREKSSHDSMLKSGQDDASDADSSPSTPRTASSIDDGLSPLVSAAMLKKKSAPKLHFGMFVVFNSTSTDTARREERHTEARRSTCLKSNKTENMDEECSDSETADELSEIDYLSAKRPTSESIRSKHPKSPADAQGNIRLYGVVVPAPRMLDSKVNYSSKKSFDCLII
ncbi:hypothetical protein COOONC_02661 [Cooperia oncophora]